MGAAVRMTLATRRVLAALLDAPESYGAEIGAAAHLPSGTIHPILARLEGVGWATSRWEDVDPAAVGRPPRRYYALTGEGRTHATAALDATPRRAGRPRPGLA